MHNLNELGRRSGVTSVRQSRKKPIVDAATVDDFNEERLANNHSVNEQAIVGA